MFNYAAEIYVWWRLHAERKSHNHITKFRYKSLTDRSRFVNFNSDLFVLVGYYDYSLFNIIHTDWYQTIEFETSSEDVVNIPIFNKLFENMYHLRTIYWLQLLKARKQVVLSYYLLIRFISCQSIWNKTIYVIIRAHDITSWQPHTDNPLRRLTSLQ